MCDETYHGWPNRETWAFHLWVTNEQATADEARRVVTAACAAMDGARNAGRFVAAEALRVWWRDTLDAARENGYRETLDAMRDDVGSLWRIDWQAVAAALLDDEPDDASSAPLGEQHPSRSESDAAAPGRSECPDGLHRWVLVREYRGRDWFSVTALNVQPDGVRVTADGSADSDEIVEVHSERLVCGDCPAQRGDVTTVEYRL